MAPSFPLGARELCHKPTRTETALPRSRSAEIHCRGIAVRLRQASMANVRVELERSPTGRTFSIAVFSGHRALVSRSLLLSRCSSRAFHGVRSKAAIHGLSTSKASGSAPIYRTPPPIPSGSNWWLCQPPNVSLHGFLARCVARTLRDSDT